MKQKLIAPCGMNCALCRAYLREKDKCPGCRDDVIYPYCRHCIIRNCPELKSSKSKYCGKCDNFPCRRLKNLDKRYRTKYGMSMIENVNYIHKHGIRKFIRREKRRWQKGGKIFCVHNKEYFKIK